LKGENRVFDLLKKKISGFVDKLSGKGGEERKKGEEAPPEAGPAEKKEPVSDKGGAAREKAAPPKETKGAKVSKKEEKKAEAREKEVKKAGAPKKKAESPKAEAPKKEKAEHKAAPKEAPAKKEEIPARGDGKAEVEEKGAGEPAKEAEGVKAGGEPAPEKGEKEVAAPRKAQVKKEKKGFLEGLFGGKRGGEKAEEAPKPVKAGKAEIEEEEEPAKEVEPEEVKPAPKAEVAKAAPEEKKEGGEAEGEKTGREEKREEELKKKVKKSIFASVSETIRGESEVREEEVAELLDELELGMLESDVALSVAEEIKEELKKRILGSKVKRGQTAAFVRDSLRDILIGMFEETPGFDLAEKMKGEGKPHKIMVVGPNGSGKTTTIAKLVSLLQKSGSSVCVAASDTFRAAAVEQLVHHGEKLGVAVIHGAYGSDPTSIAFDAMNHAKANEIDVVIIDTAGRQDTNVNLINQLKKMDRVIKPELKIYVGESIAGNAMVEQISTFNTDVGLDGVVLTKLDCDPKGGTVISVSRVAKLPILYVGVGQGYGDLKKFNAKEIVGEILS
jgi:fused signal recognition particle receptor